MHITCEYCGQTKNLDPSASYHVVCPCEESRRARELQERARIEGIKKASGGRRRRDRGSRR